MNSKDPLGRIRTARGQRHARRRTPVDFILAAEPFLPAEPRDDTPGAVTFGENGVQLPPNTMPDFLIPGDVYSVNIQRDDDDD